MVGSLDLQMMDRGCSNMNRSIKERYEDIHDKARIMLNRGESLEIRAQYEVWKAASEGTLRETWSELTLGTMIAEVVVDEEKIALKNKERFERGRRFGEIKESLLSLPKPDVIEKLTPSNQLASTLSATTTSTNSLRSNQSVNNRTVAIDSRTTQQRESSKPRTKASEPMIPILNRLPTTEENRRPAPPRKDASEVEVFTHDRIRIDCLYPIQSLSGLSIVRELNEHGKLMVSGIVPADGAEDLIVIQSENAPIEVYGQGLKEEVLLFSGRITQVEIIHINQVYTIKIEAMSATNILDDVLRTRSFQNKDMTFTELIDDLLSKHYPQHHVINTTENSAIGKMKLQYEESEWDFIKRLATHFNTVLVPDITYHEIPRFWFGLPDLRGEFTDVTNFSVSRDQVGFVKAQGAGLHVQDSNFIKYRVESRDVLGLGEKVEFRGADLRVQSVEMVLKNSVLCYTYTIGHERASQVPLNRNECCRAFRCLVRYLRHGIKRFEFI